MSKSIPAFKKHLEMDEESEKSDRTFDSNRNEMKEEEIMTKMKKRVIRGISMEFRRKKVSNDINSTYVVREKVMANQM